MEFNFEVQEIFSGQITVIAKESNDSSSLKIYDVEFDKNSKCRRNWTYTPKDNNTPKYKKAKKMKPQLETVIDEMGIASAKAQHLHIPITSVDKLLQSNQQTLYVMKDTKCPRAVIGILKVGIKNLFLNDEKGTQYEASPLCILDFYVHETKQRRGYGHALFDAMLKAENISPDKLAIDCPSPNLLSFLTKHYNLSNALQQANNFVVFPSFFQGLPVQQQNRKSTLKHLQNSQFYSDENRDSEETNLAANFGRNRYGPHSTEGLLQWDVRSQSSLDNLQENQNVVDSNNQDDDTTSEMNWGVMEAMHSYQRGTSGPETSILGHVFESSATTISNSLKNCHKWDQLQTSWNVLGVHPQHYSKFQN